MSGAHLTTEAQRRKPPRRHHWRVVFRNDVMGFQKTTVVAAVGYAQAVTFAGDRLVRQGYERHHFAVVRVERGTPAPEEATGDDA